MPSSIDLMPHPFEWVYIPAGKVKLTDRGGYLEKTTTFDVSAFEIAKYPTTNAQFDVFVNHPDGYKNPAWWDFSEEAKKWRAGRQRMNPSEFNEADCPRDTVSWYDSVAFCHWLSAMTDEKIMLPTEQQWQRAAQGDTKNRFPWGDEIDETFVNYNEKIGRTTPVTQYPKGASPYGVMNMAGNVWEWCVTSWYSGNETLIGSSLRIFRGGCWGLSRGFMRSTHRNSFYPTYLYNDNSFRISRF